MLLMMDIVRIDHPFQVRMSGLEPDLDPAMYDHIMENEVKNPIAQDPNSQRGQVERFVKMQ